MEIETKLNYYKSRVSTALRVRQAISWEISTFHRDGGVEARILIVLRSSGSCIYEPRGQIYEAKLPRC